MRSTNAENLDSRTLGDAGKVPIASSREIVAVVIEHDGRFCLLRRSRLVASDRGRWQCVTGFVESGCTPKYQAIVELQEETGINVRELDALITCAPLALQDGDGSQWLIHPFLAQTNSARIRLNWEHVSYRWVYRREIPGPAQVAWLPRVVDRCVR